MKRFLVLGLTLLTGAGLSGQTTPDGIYVVYPGTTVKTATEADAAKAVYKPSAVWAQVAVPKGMTVSVHAAPQAALPTIAPAQAVAPQAALPTIAPAQAVAPHAVPAPQVKTPTVPQATPAAPQAMMPTVTPANLPPAAPYFDPLQPLGGMLWRTMPTAPTVPAGVYASGTCSTGNCGPACGAPLFPTTQVCGPNGCVKTRPCLERVIDWLTYHPGPSVLPLFTPTPHRAPLRDYFACPAIQTPGYASGGCASGNCATATAGCTTGCGNSGNVLTRALGIASGDTCAAPKHKGLGLFAHPSSASPTTCSPAYDCVPVAVPLPAACVGYGAGCRGNACGGGALSRVLRHFTPGHGSAGVCTNAACTTPGCTGCAAGISTPTAVTTVATPDWTPTWTAATPPTAMPTPTVMGYVPAAAPTSYHFADPTSSRPQR
jgi:hypothetical protein